MKGWGYFDVVVVEDESNSFFVCFQSSDILGSKREEPKRGRFQDVLGEAQILEGL